jgi:glycosyltransferase involved in cell wall biosynthesis
MFEFLDWPPPSGVPAPDLFAAPSLWRWADVPLANKVYLPVPVNRSALPYRRRESLRTLLHTAGTGAPHDRNGTGLLVEAMRLLPRDVKVELTIASHRRLPKVKDRRIKTSVRVMDRYTDLYQDEDAFVMPRKYGGLCLPLNEAAACGMPVIMTDLPPQNEILPGEALVPAAPVSEFMMRSRIRVYETTPRVVAHKITELYRNPDLVAKLSDASNAYADSISWDQMLPVYKRVFEDLL